MLDDTTYLFTITDLKQYIYCPRILFYHRCLPDIRPVTYKMRAGIEAHEIEQKRATRRTLNTLHIADGQRHFDVDVASAQLSFVGQVDEVIETDSELVPVDYKLARHDGYHFKLQLAAYSLLLEETFHKPVHLGYLYLIPLRKTVKVAITPTLRRAVVTAVKEMQQIEDREQMPPPTEWRQRCVDCEFRRFCNDV
jgi:CRISPR-associated exonuclease Cas4